MSVSPEDFVRAWQASSSCSEAAKKLGMTPNSVSVRAAHYRRKGVRLKIFQSGKRLNVPKLNDLIDAADKEPDHPD